MNSQSHFYVYQIPPKECKTYVVVLFHAGILAQIDPNDYPDKRLEAVYTLYMTLVLYTY